MRDMTKEQIKAITTQIKRVHNENAKFKKLVETTCQWYGLVYQETCGNPEKKGLTCSTAGCPFRR